MTKWKLVFLPLVILALVVTACPPKHVPEIDEAASAIAAAKSAGAEQYAPTKLRAAEEALEAAKRAQQARSYSEAVKQANIAKRLAEEARAEAIAAREAASRVDTPPDQPEEHATREGVDYAEIFKNVYFDFDQSSVKSAYRPDLDGAAKHLNENDNLAVVVTGYCDPRGTDEYNMALGERRARSVRDYLVNSGVNYSRVRIVSKGESELVDPSCQSEDCWWEERRAVFSVED